MSNKPETNSCKDIAADLREDARQIRRAREIATRIEPQPTLRGRFLDEIFEAYADRAEAAAKREVDALKQRLAELNAEIAAKDEVIMRLNDALAEEQKRSGLRGNMAKLRAVVEDLLYMARRYVKKTAAVETVIFDSKTHEALKTINYYKTIEKAEAALAAPARNCDMYGGDFKMLHTAWFDWTGSPSGHNADGTVKLTFAEYLLATTKKGSTV